MKSNNQSLPTKDADLKNAIISCVREEVRNAIYSLSSIHVKESCCNDAVLKTSSLLKSQTRPKRISSFPEIKVKKNNNGIPRPKTANTLSNNYKSRIHSQLSNVTHDIYTTHGRSLPRCRSQPASFSSRLSEVQDDSLSDIFKSKKDMSLSSFNWLKKSASVVIQNGGRDHDEIYSKLDAERSDELHKTDSLYSSIGPTHDIGYNRNLSKINESRKHVKTAPSPTTRNRPTTALDRRSRIRPNTAILIREKAESLGNKMLNNLQLNDSNPIVPSQLPSKLEESEWENELARHIVNLYKNKVLFEVTEKVTDVSESKLGNESISEFEKDEQYLINADVTDKEEKINETSLDLPVNGSSLALHATNNNEYMETLPSTAPQFRNSKRLVNHLKPRMIWFRGTGDVHEHWDFKEGDESNSNTSILNNTLRDLESSGKYATYIDVIQNELLSRQNRDEINIREKQWKKLILVTNSFGMRLVDQKKFPHALALFDKANSLISCDGMIQSSDVVNELTAIVNSSYACYYAKRNKPSAALQYILTSSRICKKRMDVLGLAKCNLHRAYILHQLNRFGEALKFIHFVLDMVESGLFDKVENASSSGCDDSNESNQVTSNQEDTKNQGQVVILIAVTYHNLAVQQIIMGYIGDACVSSQNARRLAKICLSVSSRYLASFEETHIKALSGLSSLLKQNVHGEKEGAIFQKLIKDLFE